MNDTRSRPISHASQHDSQSVHDALFDTHEASQPARSLDELKDGIRAHVKRHHLDKAKPKLAGAQQLQAARKP